nr:hypothetical protein [uncultured Noviherbaspirillum sp.]
MGKAKIGFEVDEDDLANAKAFVARHGGSLNKLVSALFASLGKDEAMRSPAIDPAMRVLLNVSIGKISIMEGARQLELQDAGHLFLRLEDAGLPLPRLSKEEVNRQLAEARNALDACLIEPVSVENSRSRKSRGQATSA